MARDTNTYSVVHCTHNESYLRIESEDGDIELIRYMSPAQADSECRRLQADSQSIILESRIARHLDRVAAVATAAANRIARGIQLELAF